MPKASLPHGQTALASLRLNGDPLATSPLTLRPTGARFTHPQHGMQAIKADPRVVAAVKHFYVGHDELRIALMRAGKGTNTLRSMQVYATNAFKQSRLLWGVSGYASIGFPCDTSGLEALYGYLAVGYNKPYVVVDGAGPGILGVSGVLAAMHDIKTLGVIPLEGVATMMPRTYMVVYGTTFKEREVIIALMSDVLAVDGDGIGTRREVLAALRNGSHVLMLRPPDESIVTWWNVPEIADALDKQLFVCQTIDEIPEQAERIKMAASRTIESTRPARLNALSRRFHA